MRRLRHTLCHSEPFIVRSEAIWNRGFGGKGNPDKDSLQLCSFREPLFRDAPRYRAVAKLKLQRTSLISVSLAGVMPSNSTEEDVRSRNAAVLLFSRPSPRRDPSPTEGPSKKLQSKFDRSTFRRANRISPVKLLACSSITVAHDGTRGSRGLYLNDNLVPGPGQPAFNRCILISIDFAR